MPSQYTAATPDQLGGYLSFLMMKGRNRYTNGKGWLDEREVETSDKMVLAALGDGSVVGIHLGTKKEVRNGMMDDYA